jgi:hypothetical protein
VPFIPKIPSYAAVDLGRFTLSLFLNTFIRVATLKLFFSTRYRKEKSVTGAWKILDPRTPATLFHSWRFFLTSGPGQRRFSLTWPNSCIFTDRDRNPRFRIYADSWPWHHWLTGLHAGREKSPCSTVS